MNVGSLFAGIGGFDLGLERAGMRRSGKSSIDAYCRAVLARHFPDAERYEDVREVGAAQTSPPVDVLCGGFPCQDLSLAGQGAGIDGARSGLWSEYARIIGELRPRYVVVENVSALLARGLGRVLGDLAALGYDAEWDCIRLRPLAPLTAGTGSGSLPTPSARRTWASAHTRGRWTERGGRRPGVTPTAVLATGGLRRTRRSVTYSRRASHWTAALGRPCERDGLEGDELGQVGSSDWWRTEPDVGRVAHGVPARVDRLRSLGNALVPQIAEWIGRRILEHEAAIVRPRFTPTEREAM